MHEATIRRRLVSSSRPPPSPSRASASSARSSASSPSRPRRGANFAQLLKSLHNGVYAASALIVLGAFGLLYMLFGTMGEDISLPFNWWGLGLSIVSGLARRARNRVTPPSTTQAYEHAPTKRIAEQALTGSATVIIAGIAEGMKSTWASLAHRRRRHPRRVHLRGRRRETILMGLYGVGIAAVGMLSTLGITLATDAYGPIADNAGGNAEMTSQPPHVRERTDLLDSLGNTTAATGKGFAIGSAALTALALFAAFLQIVQVQIGQQAINAADGKDIATSHVRRLRPATASSPIIVPGHEHDGETSPAKSLTAACSSRSRASTDFTARDIEKGQVFDQRPTPAAPYH